MWRVSFRLEFLLDGRLVLRRLALGDRVALGGVVDHRPDLVGLFETLRPLKRGEGSVKFALADQIDSLRFQSAIGLFALLGLFRAELVDQSLIGPLNLRELFPGGPQLLIALDRADGAS